VGTCYNSSKLPFSALLVLLFELSMATIYKIYPELYYVSQINALKFQQSTSKGYSEEKKMCLQTENKVKTP